MLPGHKHIQMAKVKESNFYLCLEEEYSKCFKVFWFWTIQNMSQKDFP